MPLAERAEAFLDGAAAGNAEDVCEEEDLQAAGEVAAWRISIVTWFPESFV